MRSTIDVLTLTATPIPRTLQLSLSGIRGLSVIETPPQDRKPVETSLMERDPNSSRPFWNENWPERDRLWVYNRVQGLAQVAEFVSSLVPQARWHGSRPYERPGSGRYHAQILARRAGRFGLHGHRGVGLIFHGPTRLSWIRLHLFGLGQLYQLRGRVGAPRNRPTPISSFRSWNACRRLPQASENHSDMDYLGAGFKVAMEDLRLRGRAIFWRGPSGTIGKVGLISIWRCLKRKCPDCAAARRRRSSRDQSRLSGPIPEEYISDGQERLQYYKSLSSRRSEAEILEIVDELRDRFGLPEALKTFTAVLMVKIDARRLGGAGGSVRGQGACALGRDPAQSGFGQADALGAGAERSRAAFASGQAGIAAGRARFTDPSHAHPERYAGRAVGPSARCKNGLRDKQRLNWTQGRLGGSSISLLESASCASYLRMRHACGAFSSSTGRILNLNRNNPTRK